MTMRSSEGMKADSTLSSVVLPLPVPPEMTMFFLAITLLNPMTVVYFAALSLGLPSVSGGDPAGRLAFIVGAFGASLSWQLLLAGLGAIAHRRLPPRFQLAISLLGNVIIVLFAAAIATGA